MQEESCGWSRSPKESCNDGLIDIPKAAICNSCLLQQHPLPEPCANEAEANTCFTSHVLDAKEVGL